MTRKPERWEWEYFARLDRRIVRCEDFDDGRGTRYTTVEDATIRARLARAESGVDEIGEETYDRPPLPASLVGGVA